MPWVDLCYYLATIVNGYEIGNWKGKQCNLSKFLVKRYGILFYVMDRWCDPDCFAIIAGKARPQAVFIVNRVLCGP